MIDVGCSAGEDIEVEISLEEMGQQREQNARG